MPRRMKQLGFTLIEMMIAVAVAGILVVLALPNYQRMIESNCMTAVANEFIGALQYARSEAAKRASVISINRTGSHWEEGWSVQVGADVIRTQTPSCATAMFRNLDGDATVFYSPRGGARKVYRFSVCIDESGETGRNVSISRTGRPVVSERVCT